MGNRWGWCAALALALGVPSSASAFCGFYVSGANGAVYNDATLVVLMREGNHTVLSMQNDYRGPPEDFAMVVPVPTVLRPEDVRTLPRDLFERIERLSAPRLVEYWEQDPCTPELGIGLGSLGTIGFGGGQGFGRGSGAGAPLVTVEARFAVGEYDIVILGARDSSALETWLREHGYRIPEGAAATLRPYVEASTKFFVARVNAARVRFQGGRAVLSPLRVHYTSDELSLPIRLGLLNSSGAQDLIVHVLARGQRYEVANRRNVTIPTNLDVTDATRARFAEVYAALFDRTVAENPSAVVTEYAWQATSCDPCPPESMLTDQDLVTLGADVALGRPAAALTSSSVRIQPPVVRGALPVELVRRILRRNTNQVRFCHEQALMGRPGVAGQVTVGVTVDGSGQVASAQLERSTVGDERVDACVTSAARRWHFPTSADGVTQISATFVLEAGMAGFRGRSSFEDLVITRLHHRYGQDGLSEDLVFRAAAPIEGGREVRTMGGQLEQGAMPSHVNNFQARYAIRHAWTGPVTCESPRRGIWGSRPGGQGSAPPSPAVGLGTAARGGIELASFVTRGLSDAAVPLPQAPQPAAEPAEVQPAAPAAAPAAEPAAAATQPAPPAAPTGGCAASSRGASSGSTAGALLVILALVVGARRRR